MKNKSVLVFVPMLSLLFAGCNKSSDNEKASKENIQSSSEQVSSLLPISEGSPSLSSAGQTSLTSAGQSFISSYGASSFSSSPVTSVTPVPTMKNFTEVNNYLFTVTLENDYFESILDTNGFSNDTELVTYIQDVIFYDSSIDDSPLNALKTSFACSSFTYHHEDNDIFLARNYDMTKECPSILVHNIPRDGYESFSMVTTEFMGLPNYTYFKQHIDLVPFVELIPLDGMNTEGLAINCNMSTSDCSVNQTDSNKFNLLPTIMIRYVLNKCKTVNEALNVILNSNMHCSLNNYFHYQIIDKYGNSAVVEFYNNETVVIQKQNSDPTQIMCNTSINEYAGLNYHDWRFNSLTQAVADHPSYMSLSDALDALYDARLSHNQWALVYNVTDLTINFYVHQERSNVYSYILN